MATFRKRNGKWHVQIRKAGCPQITKSFTQKKDAQLWANKLELKIEAHGSIPIYEDHLKTLGDILSRYKNDITSAKRGAIPEASRLDKILRNDIACIRLDRLSAGHIAGYRDQRLGEVSATSVIKELMLLSHALDTAKREWGANIQENVVRQITKPKPDKPRDRRLNPNELELLLKSCRDSWSIWLEPLVIVAIETAMRRGELLGLNWDDIDFNTSLLRLDQTKNGTKRDVPLSFKAVAKLESIPKHISGSVFPVSIDALRGLWNRACKRAGITDLHFHDLRHEATSRFFEKGLNVMEVATITGHKDLRMLQRYTHLRAEDLAKKLG